MIYDLVYPLIDFMVTCLEAFFVLYLMRNEEKKRRSLFLDAGFYMGFVGSIVFMTTMNIPLLVKFSVEIAIITVAGNVLFKCGLMKALLYGIIYIFSVYCSELIIIQSWNIFYKPVLTNNIIYKEFTLSLLILCKATHFLLIVIFVKIMKKNKLGKRLQEIGSVLALSFPFILVLEGINMNLSNITEERNAMYSLCSSPVILGAFIFIIIFNDRYLEVRQMAQREETALNELQLKYNYYQKKLKDEELIKEIYHDMKNHILLTKESIDRSVIEKMGHYENYYDTGNEFLNIIITDKYEKAKEKKIQLEYNINFEGCDYIDPLDISTIFGNILDNAIEACEMLPEDKRYVFLKVITRGSIRYIVLKNKMVNSKIDLTNRITTNKINKIYHGYGINNVKKAVRKYNGECKIVAENNEFIISIILPLPEKEKILDGEKI